METTQTVTMPTIQADDTVTQPTISPLRAGILAVAGGTLSYLGDAREQVEYEFTRILRGDVALPDGLAFSDVQTWVAQDLKNLLNVVQNYRLTEE